MPLTIMPAIFPITDATASPFFVSGSQDYGMMSWVGVTALAQKYQIYQSYGAIYLPGQAITVDIIDQREKLSSALGLIGGFEYLGYVSKDNPSTITHATARTAAALLNLLGPAIPLPKMTPDGDGGLVFIWNHKTDPVLLVVDDRTLHLVLAATKPHVKYLEPIYFDRDVLPSEILKAVSN